MRWVAHAVGLEFLVQCGEFLSGSAVRDELDDRRFAVIDFVAADQVAANVVMALASEHVRYSRSFLYISPPTISPPARLFFWETTDVRLVRDERFEITTFNV